MKSKNISLLNLLVKIVLGFIIYGILFFIPAGTIIWLEAWIFLIISFIYVLFVVFWFWRRDPTILKSRSTVKPEKGFDFLFFIFSGLLFLSMFLIPALEIRSDLSRNFPLFIEFLGFGGVLLAYGIIFFVIKENSYASKIINVQEGQKVINTGLYSVVRHPMYLGFMVMCLSFPFAFGSIITIVPGILFVVLMMIRLQYEEKNLIKDLNGYKEYVQKVKYRLIPKIW